MGIIMRRFKDFNLTDEEWNEVFDYPKEFEPGDIVENNSAGGSSAGHIWEVVEKMENHSRIHKEDFVYKLKNLNGGGIGAASSTCINHIGTFIDDEKYKGI